MADDIFKAGKASDGKIGGVFNGVDVKISLGTASAGSSGIKGALVQQIQISYKRQVNRIYELGSDDTYYILGRTEGTAQMNNIVGPSDAVNKIIDALSDACEVTKNVLKIDATPNICASEGGSPSKVNFSLEGCILTDISVTVSVQDFTIAQQATIMFSKLTK